MFWDITWITTGCLAFIMVLINLIRSFQKKEKGWQTLMFASLSAGCIAVLAWFQIVDGWVQAEDVSAIYDVVPTLAKMLSIAVGTGIVLNLLVLLRNGRYCSKSGTNQSSV